MSGALLLDWALKAGLLMACAAAGEMALRRASAAARHLVWVLALGACLVLPLTGGVLPAWRVVPRWGEANKSEAERPVAVVASDVPRAAPGRVSAERAVAAGGAPAATGAATVAEESHVVAAVKVPVARGEFSWLTVLYLAGAGVLLLVVACDPIVRWRLVVRSEACGEGRILEALEGARRALKVRRRVVVRVSKGDAIPLAVGLWRPMVVLPADAAEWTEGRLRMVLLHELAHIRRRDAWTHLLARVACAFYFFHPLVWLGARRMAALRERAADDLVLAGGERASEYATTLLEFTVLARRGGLIPVFSAALPMARGNGKGRSFEARVRALLSPGARRSLSRRGAMVLAVLALAVAVPIAMLAAQSVPATRAGEQATHIRELVYVLRNNVIWSRPEETYAAARELIGIGKPAVPELSAELKHKPGDAAIRVIAFTLRNIGDPRAVPTLIDTLGDTRIMASDCGDRLFDKELWKFVTAHTFQGGDDNYPEFSVHRADREIIAALKTMTHHSVSDKLTYSARDNQPEHLQAAEDGRQNDMMLWKQWWDDHAQEFATKEAMKEIQPWGEGEDPVLAAGEAKFGSLFPTGKAARLGPVHDLFFEQKGEMDSKMRIDLDTGRTFMYHEGLRAIDPATATAEGEFILWWRQTGIDAEVSAGILNPESKDPAKPEHFVFDLSAAEMRVWQIANERWDSLDAEIASGKPINKGKFAASSQILNRDLETGELREWMVFPRTYLFWTREGGRGILQMVASTEKPPGLKMRYRLYEGLPQKKVEPPPALSTTETLVFGEAVKVTLPTPLSGKPSVLDLDTGKLDVMALRPARTLIEAVRDLATPSQPLPAEVIDGNQQAAAAAAHLDVVAQPQAEGPLWALDGFNMLVGSVGADAWEKYTPEQVAEVLSRCRKTAYGDRQFMEVPDATKRWPYQQGVYVFQTREGGRGILQVMEGTDKPQTLVIRYKLMKSRP